MCGGGSGTCHCIFVPAGCDNSNSHRSAIELHGQTVEIIKICCSKDKIKADCWRWTAGNSMPVVADRDVPNFVVGRKLCKINLVLNRE